MKICFKCGIEKPLSDYYKHKQMGDGHLNKCKDCTKKDVSNNEVIRKTDFDLKIVNLNIPADESEHVIFKNLPPDTLVLIDNLPIGKTDATENLELSFAPQDSGIHKIILMNQNHTLSSGTFNLTAYEN